jgi:hypothetical protein
MRPHAPEEGAVASALHSVAAYAEATARAAGTAAEGNGGSGGDEAGAARRRAYRAVHGAWSLVEDARRRRSTAPGPRLLVLYALILRLEPLLDAVTDAARRGSGAAVPPQWAPSLREAAAAVKAGEEPVRWPSGAEEVGGAVLPPPVGGGALSSELLDTALARWPRPLPPRYTLRTELAHLLSRASPAPVLALRVGLAVAVGTTLGALLPVLHPAWVAVGAAAALQGAGQQPVRRSWGRLTGTVAGAGLTAAVCHFHEPGTWGTVVAATVVHAVARAVPVNAMFTRMLLNTPVALLLVAAVLPPDETLEELALYRMLDLGLGLAVGLAAAVLLPGVPARRVCAALARAVSAAGTALSVRLGMGTADSTAEGVAWRRMKDLWTMHATVPAEELRSTGTADRLWPAVLAVRRLLVPRLLGGPPAAPDPQEGARISAYVDGLASAAREGLPGSPEVRSLLDGRPLAATADGRSAEVRHRLRALRDALRGDGYGPDTGK